SRQGLPEHCCALPSGPRRIPPAVSRGATSCTCTGDPFPGGRRAAGSRALFPGRGRRGVPGSRALGRREQRPPATRAPLTPGIRSALKLAHGSRLLFLRLPVLPVFYCLWP
ncbi:mCG141128, partial [Mus musculus]